ncbi:MAG: DUF3086 domain-containing protein [Cyanobacteria bacterium J06621_8]
MTSDNFPPSESDNHNLEAAESSEQPPAQTMPTDAVADFPQDIWSDDRGEAAETPDLLIELEEIIEPSTYDSASQSMESEIESEADLNQSHQESSATSELFVDSWLEESAPKSEPDSQNNPNEEILKLEQQKAQLIEEIAELKVQKEQMLSQQLRELQENLVNMIEEGTRELKERKTALRIEIEKLERRQERINQEMRSNFAGSSKELAIRVQGFKEYLVGSLQDLVTAADKLELGSNSTASPQAREAVRSRPSASRGERTRDERRRPSREERGRARGNSEGRGAADLSASSFSQQSRRIRQLLDQYRSNPDYYGSPWQLRRTFEANQAQKVQEWFLGQGGRGTIDSMGSRLQNILVASAAISILHSLHSDRCRVLVLTDTPENLGEWRRGLQDCLGISRNNFGANRGVTLFDAPEVLVQRAERLLSDKLLPVIIIDESEELLNPSILKFPIWMAFAVSNKSASSNYLY